MKKTLSYRLRDSRSQTDSLFSLREQYRVNHGNRGSNIALDGLSDHYLKKLKQKNMHLMHLLEYTGKNQFPVMKPFTIPDSEFEIYSYKERNKHASKPWGVHFFGNDYTFNHAITDKLEKTTASLSDCDLIFAPDCSMYVDMPLPLNKMSIFQSRFAGAYWQYCGFNVVQTASWGDAKSLEYCFEGLAKQSDTAICGVGHNFSKSAKRLWIYAVQELVTQKSPTRLIIYGNPKEVMPDFGVPVVFIKDHITQHFRA